MTLAEAMRCSQETARALEAAARNDPFIGAMLSGIEHSTCAMPEGDPPAALLHAQPCGIRGGEA